MIKFLKNPFSKKEKEVEVEVKDPIHELFKQKIIGIENIYKRYGYSNQLKILVDSKEDYIIYDLVYIYSYKSIFKIIIFNNGNIILKLIGFFSSKNIFIENDESIKFLNINKCIDYAFDVLSKGMIIYFDEMEKKEELKKISERIELERFDRIIE